MNRKIELLAPGGDVNAIKSAILAGANAVFCGLDKFNARNRAKNICFNDLLGIIRLAHEHNCEVFLTLNILLVDSDISALFKMLNRLVNTKIDGVIVQDLGLMYILKTYFKSLKVHASTQFTTHNEGQIQFLKSLNAERVNLSRELNLKEIEHLTKVAHNTEMLTEVFVHGSYCISFSGQCYMSALHGGNSANRGQCSQPCRAPYLTTKAGKIYPFNLKDNSAFTEAKQLVEVGVDSLKIEGRIKESEYVYTTVSAWREQLNRIARNQILSSNKEGLYKVFNRDFSNGYLLENIDSTMFIDNPMSFSSKYFALQHNNKSVEEIQKIKKIESEEKESRRAELKKRINSLCIEKIPVSIHISGEQGIPICLNLSTPTQSFTIQSSSTLSNEGTEPVTAKMFEKRLKAVDETEYQLKEIQFLIEEELYLPFSELAQLKKQVIFILNGEKSVISPVHTPKLPVSEHLNSKSKLSVLISSTEDQRICIDPEVDYYFALPNRLGDEKEKITTLFENTKNIKPWFPAILIAEEYAEAVSFLKQINPTCIVANNTGIAFEAEKLNIDWIAGPHLNVSNSFSLLTLQEFTHCIGSFLSSELNKKQLKQIKRPNNFDLYYSIYEPIVQMTTRQCLIHNVEGCQKQIANHDCIQHCDKSTTLTNKKMETFYIVKDKNCYTKVFNDKNLLNTKIAKELPNVCTNWFVDLSDISTSTKLFADKEKLIEQFKYHVKGNVESTENLEKIIQNTVNTQYNR